MGIDSDAPKDELSEFVFDNEVEFVAGKVLAGSGEDEEEDETELEAKRKAELSEREALQEERRKLPVYPWREQFLEAVEKHQALVIVAETGAGKTTQLP